MRVLHLNSMLTGGGTDDQCLKLVAGLRKQGAAAFLAAPAHRALAARARGLNLEIADTGQEGLLKSGFILRAAKMLRRERIQIVHGHHGRDIWPAIIAARISSVHPRIVLTRHMAKSPGSGFSKRYMLSSCDCVIAVSEFVKRVLSEGVYEPNSPEEERRSRPPVRGDHSKIHVIYGGVDTERFRPLGVEDAGVQALRRKWGLSPEQYAFGVVGGFDLPRGKGQREFLQAAARISERAPNARFLIVGSGSMETVLNEDIARLGLQDKARLTGHCDDMISAMNALDCLVHPQVGTEAFGLVVCEAHACGRPVIASDLDGIPEAFRVGQYGRLVAAEDIEALSSAMEVQIRADRPSEEARMRLHEKVRESFSVERMSMKTLELYRELGIKGHSR